MVFMTYFCAIISVQVNGEFDFLLEIRENQLIHINVTRELNNIYLNWFTLTS